MILKSQLMIVLEQLLRGPRDPIPRSEVKAALGPFLKIKKEIVPAEPGGAPAPNLDERTGVAGAVEELDAVLKKFKEKRLPA